MKAFICLLPLMFTVFFVGLPYPTAADQISAGPLGIDAFGLGPDGAGVVVGQVDYARPRLPNLDHLNLVHPDVSFAEATVRGSLVLSSHAVDTRQNATAVIMAGANPQVPDVAPDARIYSSAYITLGSGVGAQHALLSTQHVAAAAEVATAVVNHSWSKGLPAGVALDGSSLLNAGVDWIAARHDVLHVVAGNETDGGFPLPTDLYNGVVVAAAGIDDKTFSRFPSVNFLEEDAVGSRTSIDLVAPGEGIWTADDRDEYMLPHGTGGAALVRQKADQGVASGLWNADAKCSRRCS